VALATTGVAAGPAWAKPRPITTTTTAAVTTTTAGPSLVPTPPAPEAPDSCVTGSWPSAAEGRPAAFLAGSDGAYLWHDPDGGWALRVTHSGPHDRVIFSGSLTTTGKFINVQRAGDEGNDIVEVGPAKHTIFFRFVNYGWVDGLDFGTRCAPAFTVKIYVEGQLASTGAVHLGQAAVNPTSNPFRIERVHGPSGDDRQVLPTTTVPTSQPTTSTTAATYTTATTTTG
jgi:hypothetical protein